MLDPQWQSLGRHFRGFQSPDFHRDGEISHSFHFDNMVSVGASREETQMLEITQHCRYALAQQLDVFIQGRCIILNMKTKADRSGRQEARGGRKLRLESLR